MSPWEFQVKLRHIHTHALRPPIPGMSSRRAQMYLRITMETSNAEPTTVARCAR